MARSHYHCCREKAVIIPNSKCMSVALVIQHEKHRVTLSVVACLTPSHFTTPHYLKNGTIFEEKLPNMKCVF